MSLYLSQAIGNKPFHPNLSCQSCHLAGQGVTKKNAHQLTASQEVLCSQCHRNALELSHPSGFAPKQQTPVDYPLDWKGDMTCSTCHDIHQNSQGLLRGQHSGKEFCQRCHKPAFFSQMADKGISVQQLGHLSASVKQIARELDEYSIQCLNCHLHSGDAPEVNIDAQGILRHSSGSVNHPVGVDYKKASLKGTYRAISSLNIGIKLPQGRVSCVSCHVGYSKKHGALVVPKERSALCLECHDI